MDVARAFEIAAPGLGHCQTPVALAEEEKPFGRVGSDATLLRYGTEDGVGMVESTTLVVVRRT